MILSDMATALMNQHVWVTDNAIWHNITIRNNIINVDHDREKPHSSFRGPLLPFQHDL